MKRINLLPPQCQRGQTRQRLPGVRTLVAAAMGLVLTAGMGAAMLRVRSLNSQIAAAERDLDPLRQHKEQLDGLQDECHRLTAQIEAVQSLREPFPTVAALALVSRVVPEEAVVRSLVVAVPEPANGNMLAGDGKSRKADAPTDALIQIEGLATDGAVIGRIVGALAEHGLGRVRIDDSREVRVNNQRCYQFRISVSIALPSSPALERMNGSGQS